MEPAPPCGSALRIRSPPRVVYLQRPKKILLGEIGLTLFRSRRKDYRQ
jgi:hypothetical protein